MFTIEVKDELPPSFVQALGNGAVVAEPIATPGLALQAAALQGAGGHAYLNRSLEVDPVPLQGECTHRMITLHYCYLTRTNFQKNLDLM